MVLLLHHSAYKLIKKKCICPKIDIRYCPGLLYSDSPPNGSNRRSTAFPLVPSRGGSKRQNGQEGTTTDVSWWKEDSTEDSSEQDVQYCQMTADWSRLFGLLRQLLHMIKFRMVEIHGVFIEHVLCGHPL